MSLTRKASSAAKKAIKPPRQDLAAALAEREAELAEARRQQAATAEILRTISQAPTDTQPVFERIVVSAARLLGCDLAVMLLRDGDAYIHAAAATADGPMDLPPERFPIDASLNFPSRAFLDKTKLHLPDWSRIDLTEHERDIHESFGINSAFYLPMLRDDESIGVLVIAGGRPNSFGPSEIAHAESFRDQALIAIENARLFRETQEALEQQKASAEVLGAISKSVADTAPVFETILDACQRLFGSDEVGVYTIGGDDMVRVAAWRGPRAEEGKRDVTPVAESVTGRIIRERRTHHIPDLRAEPNLSPTVRERVERLGSATLLYAPMLWEDRGLGSILVARSPPRPFSDREQALLQSFADQAAIAIENARLFNETEEALQQQTAAAQILRVISSSPTNVQPVFDAIAQSAVALCEADNSGVFRVKDGLVHYVGHANLSLKQKALALQSFPAPLDRGTASGRAILSRTVVQIPDIAADPEYSAVSIVEAGFRSALSVPMLRNGEPIGAINVTRLEARPFSDRQVELLKIFADQAVIAINNVGLFNETQEALERQTATADILRVIASSPTDVQPVFEAIATSANRLLGGFSTAVLRFVGDAIHLVAFTPTNPTADEILRTSFPRPLAEFPPFLLVRDGETIQFADTEADHVPALNRELARLRGYRSMLIAPLMSRSAAIGTISVTRKEPGDFAAHHVQLLETFADQAVIAIENVRLFDEVQARTKDLQEALQQQTATANVLKVISRSAFDLDAVLNSLTKSAVELCNSTYGVISLYRDGVLKFMAQTGCTPEFAELLWSNPAPLDRKSTTGRAGLLRTVVLIPDVKLDEEYDYHGGEIIGNYRSMMGVPLLRNGELEGVFTLMRRDPGLFTPRQVELVETFADQAVIAIENARLFEEVQARTKDLQEALLQQTATADVLKVISRSAFDLQAVFDTLTASAVELCGAFSGSICVRDGDVYRYRGNAGPGLSVAMSQYLAEHPATPGRGSIVGRVLLLGKVEEIPDVLEDADYVVPLGARGQASRALLGVPLLGKDGIEGALVLTRKEPGHFTPRQIEIVQTFADQAVIAIENVRLFDEVQARTRDLTEALQQQTATADVLKAISRTAFDLDTVLETLISTATRLCDAKYGEIFRRHGDVYRYAASVADLHPAYVRHEQTTEIRPGRGTLIGRVALENRTVEIADAWNDPEYMEKEEARLGNVRAMLGVPLIRDGEPIGAFALARNEPLAFTRRQVELVTTFADQAVIAIENVRLFDEVQARTRDLEESLQQQTATADVLKVISRSAFDLDAVFDALLTSAVSLVGSRGGTICVREGDGFRYRAVAEGRDSAMWRYLSEHPPTPGRASVAGRVLLSGRPEIITDTLSDSDLKVPVNALAGSRSVAGVPLLRDNKVEGALMVGRAEAGPFDSRQIELLQTFADQAVIAIENVRLFDEVQARTRDLTEALQMQTATSDVLKVISRSAFDLQAVFNTLVSSAVELGGALTGTICVRDGDAFRYRDTIGAEHTSALAQYLRDHPATPGRSTIAGRVLISGKVERIPDCLADPDYVVPMGSLATNVRSLLGVPLLRKDGVEGAIILTRAEPGHFSDRQVEIVQTFADQAVIALENVRLFDEVQARTRELAASLDDLRKAQDRLVQSEKLASLGQLTAGIAHEIKNPLNFVNNFSALTRELVDELGETLKRAPLEKGEREEADELIGTIGANLDKVVSHGKRADSIVKNMLLHSREGSGERASVNVNAMVEEALNLAYHGARAEKPGFNVTIARSLDDKAGVAELYAQEMTRVLLNLISNGFYATAKRKQGEGNGSYEPTVTASTRDLGHSVEIAIRDNGAGIPDQVKAKMFNPFFTTKPAGEGTGLGLSLSHDIVVKQHGGTIEVSTEPGSFTQFTIVLPRAGASA